MRQHPSLCLKQWRGWCHSNREKNPLHFTFGVREGVEALLWQSVSMRTKHKTPPLAFGVREGFGCGTDMAIVTFCCPEVVVVVCCCCLEVVVM